MTDNISIRPMALKEIEEAWQWYERQLKGLGDDFILCMEELLDKICTTPELYPAVHTIYTPITDSPISIRHSLFY